MDDNQPKQGKPWTRILLVVSLGINLLIAGAVVGAYVTGGGERRAGNDGPRDNWAGPYGRALSKEDRAEMRKSFEGRRSWFRDTRRQMRGFGTEMAAAVRAEPFDPSVVKDILDRQRAVQSSVHGEGQALLIERLTDMSPDQRAAFAEKLEKGLRRNKARQ